MPGIELLSGHIRHPDGSDLLALRQTGLLGAALRPGGVLASGDAFLCGAASLQRIEMDTWRSHLRQWYSARETRAFFAAWAREDRYLPLALEVELLESAGFRVDVPWRRAPFGVVVGLKR